MAANECIWLRQLLMEWGQDLGGPTKIYEDNQQVIKLVHNGQVNTRAKYLSIKLRSVYDMIMRGLIEVTFVPTSEQWADMLTKTRAPLNNDSLFGGSSIHAVRSQGEC